jgi:hypothetical protein
VEHCHAHSWPADEHLRQAVGDIVSALKEDGVPPEGIIIAMKRALRAHAGLHTDPTLVVEERRTIGEAWGESYDRAFAYFLEVYFGVDGDAQ